MPKARSFQLGWVLFLASCLLGLGQGCRRGTDAGLAGAGERLLSATPDGERTALRADLDSLGGLADDKKLGDAERRALVDLHRSAWRDGVLDEDERALLTRLTRDVVAGGGTKNELRPTVGDRQASDR